VNFDPIIVAMMSAIQMLDNVSGKEVDPNFVVRVQEIMGDYLSELSGDDEREFREILLRIANERSSEDPLLSAYIQRLATGMRREND